MTQRIFLLVLACTVLVWRSEAASPSILSALNSTSDLGLFRGLLDSIALRNEDFPAIPFTILAPTDQAVSAFCSSMGLSYQQLKQRPELIDSLVSYHIIPATKASSNTIAQRISSNPAAPTYARTVNPGFRLRFYKAGPKTLLYVRDAQNNTADVLQPGIEAGSAVVYKANRVLLNGEVFTSAASAFQYYKRFSIFARTLKASGLLNPSKPFPNTILAVRNSALEGLTGPDSLKGVSSGSSSGSGSGSSSSSSSSGQTGPDSLAAVVRYQVVEGYRPLPSGFKPGTWYATLLNGNTLQVQVNRRVVPDANSSRKLELLSVTVLPEPGSPTSKPVMVNLHNIFAGQGIIHGVTGYLLPKPSTPVLAVAATPSIPAKKPSITITLPAIKKGAAAPPSAATPAAQTPTKQAAAPAPAHSTSPATTTTTTSNSKITTTSSSSSSSSIKSLMIKPGLTVRLGKASIGRHLLVAARGREEDRGAARSAGADRGLRRSGNQADRGAAFREDRGAAAAGGARRDDQGAGTAARNANRGYSRRMAGMDRGGYEGYRGGSSFSPATDDERYESPTFRAPDYVDPNSGAVAQRTAQSNTAYGMQMGADATARGGAEADQGWGNGWRQGSGPYGLGPGGVVPPAPLPAPPVQVNVPPPVDVNDYSNSAAPAAVYVPNPVLVNNPVPAPTDYAPNTADYEPPAPAPPIYVPNPVPNPIYVPQPAPVQYVPVPTPTAPAAVPSTDYNPPAAPIPAPPAAVPSTDYSPPPAAPTPAAPSAVPSTDYSPPPPAPTPAAPSAVPSTDYSPPPPAPTPAAPAAVQNADYTPPGAAPAVPPASTAGGASSSYYDEQGPGGCLNCGSVQAAGQQGSSVTNSGGMAQQQGVSTTSTGSSGQQGYSSELMSQMDQGR